MKTRKIRTPEKSAPKSKRKRYVKHGEKTDIRRKKERSLLCWTSWKPGKSGKSAPGFAHKGENDKSTPSLVLKKIKRVYKTEPDIQISSGDLENFFKKKFSNFKQAKRERWPDSNMALWTAHFSKKNLALHTTLCRWSNFSRKTGRASENFPSCEKDRKGQERTVPRNQCNKKPKRWKYRTTFIHDVHTHPTTSCKVYESSSKRLQAMRSF